MNIKDFNRLEYKTNKIHSRYNAEFDYRPEGPEITWAEDDLADCIEILTRMINELQTKVTYLESQLNELLYSD